MSCALHFPSGVRYPQGDAMVLAAVKVRSSPCSPCSGEDACARLRVAEVLPCPPLRSTAREMCRDERRPAISALRLRRGPNKRLSDELLGRLCLWENRFTHSNAIRMSPSTLSTSGHENSRPNQPIKPVARGAAASRYFFVTAKPIGVPGSDCHASQV